MLYFCIRAVLTSSTETHSLRARVEEGEPPIVPTERHALIDFLKSIRFNRIESVLKFCDQLGYNVEGVYYALKKSQASADVIDAVLSYWSLRRQEPIPSWIKRELKPPSYEFDWRRTFGYGYNYDEQDERRYNKTEEEDKRLLFSVGREIGELKALLKNQQTVPQSDNSNTELILSLQNKVNELEQKLRDQQIQELRKEIDELKNRKTDALTEAVHELGKFLEGYVAVIKELISEGEGKGYTPPVERVGEPNIVSQLPPELVEED